MSNCVQFCPYADENEECFGQCQTMKPKLETLSYAEVQTASPQLEIVELDNG